ncbi:MAG: glycosyltransferase, partial [Pseudomonadota bacterium]
PPPPPARPRRPETALLTVGALEEKLGVDRLLLALARLPAELRWRWRHLGGGPLQGRLTARAERLGLAPRTAFLGAAPERRAFEEMRHADLLILPGRIARNGDRAGALTAALFAASQKLAIIATPEAGVEDLVEDGVTGVYASDHPEALAAAIAALGADPQWRARLGETAHARVAARFDLRRSAQDLAALLAALERAAPLARGAARPPSPPPQPGAGAPPPPRRFVRRLS